MCGRYRLSRRKQIVEQYFTASGDEEWSARYNIATTPACPSHPPEPKRYGNNGHPLCEFHSLLL
jgi:hypothetical protein